jgi:hypothetical protein
MNPVDDDVEAAIPVYQLHNGHRADEEHHNLAGVAEGYHKFAGQIGVMGRYGIDRP